MRKLSLILAAAGLLVGSSMLGVTAAGATTTPTAHAAKTGKRGPRGKTGARGPRGFTGPTGSTGAKGATGLAGPAAAALHPFSSFSQLVPFGGTESVTVGQFTVSEVAGASACTDIKVTNNSASAASVNIVAGQAATAGPGDFVNLASATPLVIAKASIGSVGDLDTFAAVGTSGSSPSTVTGTIGGVTASGGCLTSGALAGA
ncbi:MAG: hypothetical protein M3Z06_09810 [Actinomycetota bacterium]|nr:hypothetical protein [Actinomycetota bacterium]